MVEHRYLTLEDATSILPVAAITLRRAIKAGELPAYRFGRRLLIRPSDLDVWIESRRVDPAATSATPPTWHPGSRPKAGGLLDRALKERSQP